MRILTSTFLSVALVALTQSPLGAQQQSDSALVGRWFGHAELTVPWTVQRSLVVQLDIEPDGSVSGTIGDAQLTDGHVYSDSRVARALRLGREFAIDGRLTGAIIRAEGIHRERVRLSLDRVIERMVGELQTSGSYDGPVSNRILAARVTLERVGAVVAMRAGGARLTSAHIDTAQLER
jgi:hypothetical protein